MVQITGDLKKGGSGEAEKGQEKRQTSLPANLHQSLEEITGRTPEGRGEATESGVQVGWGNQTTFQPLLNPVCIICIMHLWLEALSIP